MFATLSLTVRRQEGNEALDVRPLPEHLIQLIHVIIEQRLESGELEHEGPLVRFLLGEGHLVVTDIKSLENDERFCCRFVVDGDPAIVEGLLGLEDGLTSFLD